MGRRPAARGIPAGRLAYIQNGDVYVASADGSNAVKLLDDPAVSFTKVTWLDGGDRLAVEGQGVVTVVDLTTGQRRRVGTSGEAGTWRPGGHEFAYVRTRDGQPQVTVIVDVDTGASRELPGGGQPGGERSWSPDGRWFASALDGSVMLIDAATGVKRVIIAPAPGDPPSTYDIAWAPDGSRFAYVTHDQPGRARSAADASAGRAASSSCPSMADRPPRSPAPSPTRPPMVDTEPGAAPAADMVTRWRVDRLPRRPGPVHRAP